MVGSKKNGRVELLRFLFALAILFFHIHKRFAESGNISIGIKGIYFFNHGYIGVEFFFLVSGYLLAQSAYLKRDIPPVNIGTETANVLWKKIKGIFPYHLFAIIITIIVNGYFLEKTWHDRLVYAIDSWASVFFLQVFGFDSTWVNKLTWYLDVWLMATFIFYPLLRKYFDAFVKVICPLMALFILGYMAHEYKSIAGIDGWTGHFYKCFLRGFSEMALGCSAFALTQSINKINFTRAGHIILAIAEACSYLLVFRYAVTSIDPKYSFLMLFVMFIGLVLTFSDINPAYHFFDSPIFSRFGKLSLLIYLNQFYCIRFVQSVFPMLSFTAKTIFITALTFAGAYVCDTIAGYFIRRRPLARLLVKEE